MAKPENANKQHDQFVKTARELETNDDPAAFDALFSKLVPPIRPKGGAETKRQTTNPETGE